MWIALKFFCTQILHKRSLRFVAVMTKTQKQSQRKLADGNFREIAQPGN